MFSISSLKATVLQKTAEASWQTHRQTSRIEVMRRAEVGKPTVRMVSSNNL